MLSFLSQVWTIARHSIIQAIRMRTVAVLLVFLLVITVSLPFVLKGDSTFTGQVRLVITYTLFVISFLLSVLTVFLSSMTLNAEIRNQHMFLMDPKPINRGTVLLGKWVGVMVINVALLALMLGSTYGFVRWLYWRYEKAVDREVVAVTESIASARTESARQQRQQYLVALVGQMNTTETLVLTANSYAKPPLPDLTGEVEKIIAEKKAAGEMPQEHSEDWVRQELREELAKGAWRVEPYSKHVWKITGLPVATGADALGDPVKRLMEAQKKGAGALEAEVAAIRVEARKMSRLVIEFRHHGEKSSTPNYELPGVFVVNPDSQPTLRYEGEFKLGSPHKFTIPGTMAKADGSLEIGYANLDFAVSEDGRQIAKGTPARFPFEDGLRVLYPSSTLAWNFARSGLVILMKLAFLATVGLAASSILSFPVAVMVTFVVLLASQTSQFFIEEMITGVRVFGEIAPPWTPTAPLDKVIRDFLRYFLLIWPPFARFGTVDQLASGELISGGLMLSAFLHLFLRGLLVALFGWYLFHRRELAALTSST